MIFITVFLMKLADCALSTMKTVFLCKNRFFISSVLNSIAAVLFILVADSMSATPEDKKIFISFVIFLANFIGSYFPPKLMEKFESDKLFIYMISAKDFERGKIFSDKLRDLNIPVSTTVIYNQETEKSLSCHAYCSTRNESKIVDNVLKEFSEDVKYHIVDAM